MNPRDQFPHFRASEMAARLGDWEMALRYYQSGRNEKGAVEPETWERLFQAIQNKNAQSLLFHD
jgi:hypothetical protein